MLKLYGAYAVVALLPAGLFVLIQFPLVWHWHTIHSVQTQRNLIKEEVLRLHRLTADIENGFRGYVLTHQSAFLHPVVYGEAKVRSSLDQLLRLTEDLPNLYARIKVLEQRLHELIDTKRRLTKQMDGGDHEAVMSYIRLGDGLALSNTIEKAMEDLEIRIEREFSRFDVEETSLKERTLQKLIVADAATLLLGIFGIRLVFRSAMNGAGFGVSR